MDQYNLDEMIFSSFRNNIEEPQSDEEIKDDIIVVKKDLNQVF